MVYSDGQGSGQKGSVWIPVVRVSESATRALVALVNLPYLGSGRVTSRWTQQGSSGGPSASGDALTYLFNIQNRSEVLNLTLFSEWLRSRGVDWRFSKEESLSDHKYILFQLNLAKPVVSKIRNPRNTLWDSYEEELRGRLVEFPTNNSSIDKLEHAADFLQRALTTSYKKNRPTITVNSRKRAEWWNAHLEKLRKKTIALCNRANKTKLPSDWDTYKSAQYKYNKNKRRYKQEDGRGFCEESKDIPETARLLKILAQNPEARLGLIRLVNGEFAEDEKATLNCLMEIHFPWFQRIQTDPEE
ncbi:uncharacterized protein LOC117183000 [Belonocnema kinseyi]|uniref:uncharacterized protein LOC117183000 n=1 Tax=Belonocnema kinseyi TaxID=2817044 RepID=UPI00143CD66A|nr:uncharacterized protein LOC117183000 [Belonocnema kinseyi]